MGFSRLFRSRWSAMFWAGGILWLAYDVAGVAPRSGPGNDSVAIPLDATGSPVTKEDLETLAHFGGGDGK